MTSLYLFRQLLLLLCVALGVLLQTSVAEAQANFDGRLLGARTSMMGGAGAALGSDQSTAFINPAGLTRIPGQKFAFSTFVATLNIRTIPDFYDPTGSLNLSQSSALDADIRVIPNSFCLFLDGPVKDHFSGRSRHKFAACGADTEYDSFFAAKNSTAKTSDGIAAAQSDFSGIIFRRTSMALTWGMQVTPKMSVGTNLRVDFTSLRDETSTSAYTEDGGVGNLAVADVNRSSYSWDTSVTVGITYELSKAVTLGAALSTPSQHIYGYHVANSTLSFSAGGEAGMVQDNGDFRYNLPTSVRLALAFAWPTFTFEVDAAFYGGQKQLAVAEFDRQVTGFRDVTLLAQEGGRAQLVERGVPVTNLFAGFEKFIDSNFSFMAGAQTAFSGLVKRQETLLDDALFRQRKNAVYASAGVMSYGSAGSLLLGLRSHYGWGTMLSTDVFSTNAKLKPLSQREFSLSLVVSGQINFRAVRDTALRAVRPLSAIPDALGDPAGSDATDPKNPYDTSGGPDSAVWKLRR
ncbi:MAG: outer membrane protein transport protein [Polyangiaceae bacterium]|nr:outer membrane protein transport protein [Polyangiaceae bacterium]